MTLYLRSRRIGLALAIIVLLTIANLITGENLFTLTIGVNPVIIPYHYVLSAFIATTVINSLGSPLAATDKGDTGVLQKARWLHLIALSAIGLLLATASSAAGTGPEILEGIRAYLAWSGLALLAAGFLHESLSWTGVLCGIFIIVWFGSPDGEHAPWNWAQAPPEASASWWVSAVLLAVGLLLCHVRWRGAPLRAGLVPGWAVLRRRTLGRRKRPRGRHRL